MSTERTGCLKVLGPLADILAVKDKPIRKVTPPELHSRMVTTNNGTRVELSDTMPDDYAEVVARALSTGKTAFGNLDENGKIVEEE